RYQGAQRAGDGAWALLQARAARRHAIILAEAVEASDAVADVAAGVRALPSSVDNLSSSLRTYVGRPDVCCAGAYRQGLPADTRREAKNLGAPVAAIEDFVRAWHDIMARITFSTNARTAMASVLEAVDSTSEAAAAELRSLAADLEAIILRLEADPLVVDPWPAADAGGPYESVEGSPVLLDASASTGSIASFGWDLDGDGQFDDTAGPTASFLPPGPGNWLTGVRVVGARGHADIAYAWVRVKAANVPPVLTSPAPALRRTRIPIGESRVFVVTASDPDGDPVALEWELDGGPPAAGPSFLFTANAENAGVHGLAAIARDGRGGETRVGWIFGVTFPDGDVDGWHANVDCDDADLAIHPEAPEILNGIDDDCDPATPDGGGPPSWNSGSNPPPIVLEGRTEVRVEGTSINWGVAAGRGTVTIDWGDGTVENLPVNEREQFFAGHVYQDSGNYVARACVTNSLGRTVCRAVSVRVRNLSPIVLYEDLSAFTQEVSPNRGFGGEWEVHPLGFEVVELVNGSPTFFVSPEPFPAAFDVTVQFQVDPEGDGGDDDFVGLALGYRPGDVLSSGADHMLIDVRQNSQVLGYGDCGVNPFGLIRGNPTYVELWGHQDLECVTPESRIEVLGADPTAVWTGGTLHELRARYSSERLEVFFDGTRRLDLAGSFPEGHFALYDLSQPDAHFRVHVMPVYTTGSGEPLALTVPFFDWGVADTHTAVVDWGDLSPAETVPVTVPVTVNGDGTGSLTATHVYTTFTGQVCISDDDGARSCRPFRVEAGNAAPVVTAGPDREAGPSLVLDAVWFSDPGSQGPHTAAVDWGDGGPPEPAAVVQDATGGLVHASHQYTSNGTYTVTVCVTDEDGAQGCGALEAHVVVTNGAPEVQVSDPGSVAEGGPPATLLFAFNDPNPTDEHAVTIDWGDGTPPDTPPFQDAGAAGLGRAAHAFTDSANFPVRIQVCDGRGACGGVETVVVVANLPPVVDAGGDRDARAGATLALEASLDDPGTADT
ncbi:MAG: FG-GAP repeat-containing protein, partial [Elusimicrobia bacterium]